MSLGPAEILVVLVLALVVFGPKRLPEVGRQVGGALRELRKVQDTVQTEIRSVIDDTVGPIRSMSTHEPSTQQPQIDAAPPSPSDPAPHELHAGEGAAEPDLGDEHNQPAVPSIATPDPDPGIDGLSGGTFS
jgi:sec-independent protein translocase protein TatA